MSLIVHERRRDRKSRGRRREVWTPGQRRAYRLSREGAKLLLILLALAAIFSLFFLFSERDSRFGHWFSLLGMPGILG